MLDTADGVPWLADGFKGGFDLLEVRFLDRRKCRLALAAYYRQRTTPLYYIAPGEKANPRPAHPEVTHGDRALRHEFESIGYPHMFGAAIDWHFDKTRSPARNTRRITSGPGS